MARSSDELTSEEGKEVKQGVDVKRDELHPVPSKAHGEVEEHDFDGHDAVFGDINGGGPNYRNVGRLARSRCVAATDKFINTRSVGWGPSFS